VACLACKHVYPLCVCFLLGSWPSSKILRVCLEVSLEAVLTLGIKPAKSKILLDLVRYSVIQRRFRASLKF